MLCDLVGVLYVGAVVVVDQLAGRLGVVDGHVAGLLRGDHVMPALLHHGGALLLLHLDGGLLLLSLDFHLLDGLCYHGVLLVLLTFSVGPRILRLRLLGELQRELAVNLILNLQRGAGVAGLENMKER